MSIERFSSSRVQTTEHLVYRVVNEDMPPDEIVVVVMSLLRCANLGRLVGIVRRLPPDGQKRFLDRADQALPTVDEENAKLVTSLGMICSAIRRLPRTAQLFAGLEKRGSTPLIRSTGLTDIWVGVHGHRPVSIEAFRDYSPQLLEELIEILWKRVPMLMRLSHPNILSFRGVNMILFQLAAVYDGSEDIDVIQYIASHPDASQIALLLQAAKGLQYLHSLGIPHGDLRGNSVRIDGSGHARLTHYGLGLVKHNSRFTAAADPRAVEGLLAPELIGVTSPSVLESKAADIFAFSMLGYQVLAGQPPYIGQSPAKTALLISHGTSAKPKFL